MSQPSSKFLKTVLKILFVALLLAYLAKNNFISYEKTKTALSHWQLILPAVSLLGLNIFLGTIRWQWLLRAHGIHLNWTRTLQLGLIGNFFNLALPGAVSGDFVKAFYIGKEVQGKGSRAFGSILFDRVAGLSALVLVAAVALASDYQHFVGTPLFQAIKSFIFLGALCVIAFYSYLFLVREHHDPLLRALRTLSKRFKHGEAVARIYASLRHYHNHRATVLKVLALSGVIHLIVGWCCLLFARALGADQLTLLPIYIVVPLGLLVTAVPVAPAGVGTGHTAFAYLFNLIGFQQGADIFTLFVLCNIFYGGIGGLVYLRFRSHAPAPVLVPTTASEPIPLA